MSNRTDINTFEEFKGLSFVLRESIIQISNALVSQENKGDKMFNIEEELQNLPAKPGVYIMKNSDDEIQTYN